MKKYLKLISILAAVSVITLGCSNYLDEKVVSVSQIEDTFSTIEATEAVMLSLYAHMGDETVEVDNEKSMWVGQGNDWMSESNTDICILGPNNQGLNMGPIAQWKYTSNNSKIRATWVGLQQGVFLANTILANIDNVPLEIELDTTKKENIIAHTRFMRGFYYFYLMFYYGGVPMLNEYNFSQYSVNSSRYPERSSVEDIANFIESDWQFAASKIENLDMADDGRIGKLGVYAFLAKLNLFLASNKRYGVTANEEKIADFLDINSFKWVNEIERYTKVQFYTDEIYAAKGDNLTSVFQHLFITSTERDADVRSEMLFGINFSPLRHRRMDIDFLFRGNSDYGGGNARLRPTGKMFELTNNDFDTRAKTNLMRGGLSRTINEDGVRVPISIEKYPKEYEVFNGDYYRKPTATSESDYTGRNRISVAKYRLASWVDGQTTPGLLNKDCDINVALLRYSDVLLMRGEAYYELLGNRDVLDQMFNIVRRRAVIVPENTPEMDIQATVDAGLVELNSAYLKSNVLEEIIDERARELCYEGWRRFDLLRTGLYRKSLEELPDYYSETIINTRIKEIKVDFKEYKLWYPIPAIEVSSSGILQNPGYN